MSDGAEIHRDSRPGCDAPSTPAGVHSLWSVFLGSATVAFLVIALIIAYPPLGLSILAIGYSIWNWRVDW